MTESPCVYSIGFAARGKKKRQELGQETAKWYHVHVKMTAGPFEIRQYSDSVIHLMAPKTQEKSA
jgi:hypothetical protein